jgi:hypothetical protein
MVPQQVPLESFTAGDHFPGIASITVRIDALPPTLPIASARMRFAKAPSEADRAPAPPVELSIANAKITLVSAANWSLAVPKQSVPGLTAGEWIWNLETIDSAGVVSTYLAGTQTVFPDI